MGAGTSAVGGLMRLSTAGEAEDGSCGVQKRKMNGILRK
jgi:hypothetical protein